MATRLDRCRSSWGKGKCQMDRKDKTIAGLEERLKFLKEMGIDAMRVSRRKSSSPEGDDPSIREPGTFVDARLEVRSDEKAVSKGREVALALSELRTYIGDCTRCRLSAGRRHVVFGSGNPQADLMFIGEAPGVDEDIQGLPFVGRAGQLLTKIINAIDMDREQVYIGNIIKCRPPGNRNPQPDEIETCVPFLHQQIDIIKPKIIVALGTFAAQTLLNTKLPITALRGRLMKYRGTMLMPTFHPAFLLRNQNKKREVWEDMKNVRDELKRLESLPQ